MVPEYVTSLLIILFGYAYPAFECFKTLEEHPGHTRELQFWCQYWKLAKRLRFCRVAVAYRLMEIIVAILTVIEMFGNFLVSMLPMYNQAKLTFLVYLWHPKTMGTHVVYSTFLQPLVMQYESDIEERFKNLRAKSGQLLILYLKNFTDKGQHLFQEVLQYVVSKASSSTERIKRASSMRRPSIKKQVMEQEKCRMEKQEKPIIEILEKQEKHGVEKLEGIADLLLATTIEKHRGSGLHKQD